MSKNNPHDWQFKGPLQLLKQRAFLLAEIRSFFRRKKVLEVNTPILSSAGNTDVQIDMFNSQALATDQDSSYLRTSPEFFHKRLLASGAGDIFEMAQVFRRGERTRLHNPEFTLLEWYRTGFTLQDLMSEVIELIQYLCTQFKLEVLAVESISYQQLFERYVQLNPFATSLEALRQMCLQNGYSGSELSRVEALDFLFAVVIQPAIEKSKDCSEGLLIYHFPVEMAALAQVHPQQSDRCLRFEFLWRGIELANGYEELTDADEQLKRFLADNDLRKYHGKPELPIDQNLIQALSAGMPDCSGVALGVERLMMCLLGCQSIDQVMGFTAENS
ncbi:MAG: EF-P lysine aminoacylase EpmA [Marinicella sp.]